MGRNKDSLIALAEKLTGETCGNVLTKKDALKKIACFYAGQEVECNTVADALQCIASHCNGGGGGASGGGDTIALNCIVESDYNFKIKVEKLNACVDFCNNAMYEQIYFGVRFKTDDGYSCYKVNSATENELNFNFPICDRIGEVMEFGLYEYGNEESFVTLGSGVVSAVGESFEIIIESSSGSGGGSGETITPYAEKVYTGRGYTTALIFDHTQITGECTYTDVDGGVSNIDLSTRTTNLYLDAIDIVSFELEINGSKVTVNVNE